MEHLAPVAPEPQYRVKFKAYGAFAYDQQGFLDFPERKKVDLSTIGWIATKLPLPRRDLAALHQSWLFFGILSEFSSNPGTIDVDLFLDAQAASAKLEVRHKPKPPLRLSERPLLGLLERHFKSDAPPDGSSVLTTKNLASFLRRWDDSMMAKPSRSRLMRLMMLLNVFKSQMRRLEYAHPPILDKEESLVLAILGETLEWAVEKVYKALEISIAGWSVRSEKAWWHNSLRPHRLVEKSLFAEEFHRKGWCPSDQQFLWGVLKKSLCGLYYALTMMPPTGSAHGKKDHSECSANFCQGMHVSAGAYQTRHIKPDCNCEMMAAKESKIEHAIEFGGIALLQYNPGDQHFGVVMPDPDTPYVVVSHVWADGLGNESGNALLSCQVQRLASLTKKFSEFQGRGVHFWIDSICVPVHSITARKRAITKMFDVYAGAYATIVLSADLMKHDAGNRSYLEPAMRIVTSGWMRRLWTFQEGAVSRNLYFLFADGLKNVEDLELMYDEAAQFSPVAVAARSFYTNLLRPRVSKRPKTDAHLVAAIYRSIQWRKTTRLADETLAIARILNVDEVRIGAAPPDLRMVALLKELPEIPAGMIFLSGPRLKAKGFRWAPATWMMGKFPEFPDPLGLLQPSLMPMKWSVGQAHSVLGDRGLLVRYPGFRLHRDSDEPWNPEDMRNQLRGCLFPVDSSGDKWFRYVMNARDWKAFDLHGMSGQEIAHAEIAVICCQSEWYDTEHTAVLVLVTGESEGTLHCRWQALVVVDQLKEDQSIGLRDPTSTARRVTLIGETLSSGQLWTVD